INYDDDNNSSTFVIFNPTTSSYSHLTDTLSSGFGGSSNITGLSSISNSSSKIISGSDSLYDSIGEPVNIVSNVLASTYAVY
ncbi:unnamed protein product, partial [Rotaria sp. Silwood2]